MSRSALDTACFLYIGSNFASEISHYQLLIKYGFIDLLELGKSEFIRQEPESGIWLLETASQLQKRIYDYLGMVKGKAVFWYLSLCGLIIQLVGIVYPDL